MTRSVSLASLGPAARAQAASQIVSEEALHRAVAHYLSLALLPPAWFTTIGHGGGGKVRGGKLKSMGLKAGTPDILIIHNRAFWIELKTTKGRMSPEQRDVHEALVRAGACVAVCRSIPDVWRVLQLWEIPTRVAT